MHYVMCWQILCYVKYEVHYALKYALWYEKSRHYINMMYICTTWSMHFTMQRTLYAEYSPWLRIMLYTIESKLSGIGKCQKSESESKAITTNSILVPAMRILFYMLIMEYEDTIPCILWTLLSIMRMQSMNYSTIWDDSQVYKEM